MINPSSFLRRALIADAVFSGVAALGFTFGAGAFAPLFNLPEMFLREVGLFLIVFALAPVADLRIDGESEQNLAGQTLAVVTHGGVLSAFFRQVLGLPIEAPRRFARVNASWNVFTVENDKWMVETWGDTSHLGGEMTNDE